MARRQDRVLSKALTFSSEGTRYCVKTSGPGTAPRGATVTLHHFIGGGMTVHHKDRTPQVTAHGTYPVPDPAEDERPLTPGWTGLSRRRPSKQPRGKFWW